MKKNLYREISLKKLSSPEQLDQLIKLTSPKSWLAMLAVWILISMFVIWCFVGSVASTIEGTGILLQDAGVYSLNAESSGQVTNLRFTNGDMVNEGDIIARIDQPALTDEINELIAESSLMEEKNETQSEEYIKLQSQIEQLRDELIYHSQIVSPFSGHIINLNIQKGSVISQGDLIATIDRYSSTVELEAVLYVSAEQGGKIRSGMEAQIVPSLVNKEEYGYMTGRVVSVSEYPDSSQSMLATLGSEELVETLMGGGLPVKVVIDLTPDEATVSGYKWSASSGPSINIPSGTLIQGAIITTRETPISKIIPLAYGEVE